MNKEQLDAFINDWVQHKYADEMKSDRFTNLSAEEQSKLLDKATQIERAWIEERIQQIESKNLSIVHILHPNNILTRRLFTMLTGIKLPRTKKATEEIVINYLGRDRFEAYLQQRKAERAAKQAVEQAEREAKKTARNKKIVAKIVAGESVTGEELADAVRFLNIPTHIRTIGTLRKRVVEINSDGARIYRTRSGKKCGLSSAPYELYAKVKELGKATIS